MRLIPVLFEDHTLANFRPVALSLPVYEIRAGVFNLRERVESLRNRLAEEGLLLCRQYLVDLHPESSWVVSNQEPPADAQEAVRYLWLNGRLSSDRSALKSLVQDVLGGQDLFLRDALGPLAFSCSAPLHAETLSSWQRWEQENRNSSHFSRTGQKPSTWEPPLEQAGVEAKELRPLGWIWDVVPATARLITADLDQIVKRHSFSRNPFGIFPLENTKELDWVRKTRLFEWEPTPGVHFQGNHPVYCTEKIQLAAGAALDTRNGPILLDRQVQIYPHSYLQGPLYIGTGSIVKAGASIYGESSFGLGNRLAGEIGESAFGDFANKQHDGFIGHAVLGSWINLGAMTTCSDLKNNYGPVRVDLGLGQQDTGQRFVGLLMGDHAKTAIGTLFNTGTSVGFASNIFGEGMPPKFVDGFSWGGQAGDPSYAVDKAISTARVVMERRGCRLLPAHEKLFQLLSRPA